MLEIKKLQIEFTDTMPATVAVSDFNLQIDSGEIIGIVGESGSGKTMTALAIMGLLNSYSRIPKGEINFHGQNLLEMSQKELLEIRGKEISMIFQEPMTSLNPVLRIGEQVEEALRIHGVCKKQECKQRAMDMLRAVELSNPEKLYRKYPHQLSGGMRQRVMIAAALICEPQLLIADEPTTALDVTIQAGILQLLKKINKEKHTAILFISHNLGVVKSICDKVIVMKKGTIVEYGAIDEVFERPKDAYTKQLLAAIPTRDKSLRMQVIDRG